MHPYRLWLYDIKGVGNWGTGGGGGGGLSLQIFDQHNDDDNYFRVLQGKRAKLWIFHFYGHTFLTLVLNQSHLVCRSCIMSSNCYQSVIRLCEVITVLWLNQ